MKYVLIALLALALANGASAHTPANMVTNYSDTTKPVNKQLAAAGGTAKDSLTLANDTTYKDSNYSPNRVQVKGYFRKDGKYVAPYTRSAPTKRH